MLLLIRMALLLLLIVGVTLLGIVFCLLTLWSRNRVYYFGCVFAQVAPLFGISVEGRVAESAKNIPQAVYVANHQNNFDLFTLAAVVPKGVVTVGKTSLRWIPFFGVLYWASGNFLINRENRKQAIATIDQIVSNMKKTGLSIWMFPEGTRSRGRGWLPFKRGAFHAAVQAGVPIVPIVCSSTHGQVGLNRWNNGKVIVEMLPPIDTAGMHETDVVNLLSFCEQQMHETQQRLDQELLEQQS
ncbi:1-acylglycerol-3-phosphate O-acyltransferase [Marinomonas rhizomae]|uniref:1-acyl-sn-glycerol-3-phosphate acyltransferase n=1 Tax=Marinomonas rhizomae TaxID=491948 RepID=A0A366J038_9GAMM|nr:1-acylglycerol-3-phosphate O-acyltransferase [Marinomonas rhizomae]RBP79475.1 1-acyl-sn-glycerol-3-phosphate acyltransferase [Marinomonas rhizomae]RNF71397.1 1-acylglycerol-3-phosphate O-acyltransferase [Marinomonas rhizomae]